MIAESHEAIVKACGGHAGIVSGVASASGASFLKRASWKQEMASAMQLLLPGIC